MTEGKMPPRSGATGGGATDIRSSNVDASGDDAAVDIGASGGCAR